MRKVKVGDAIALKQDKPAWYSGYGMNPVVIIPAGEIGEVFAVNVPVVRKLEKRNSYHLARFGTQTVDFNRGDFVFA